MTPHRDFIWRVQMRFEAAEVQTARALGATWTEAYSSAWRRMDEIYDLAMAPDRPLITLGLRRITT